MVEAAGLVGGGDDVDSSEKRKKVGRREKKWSRRSGVYDALKVGDDDEDYDDEAEESEGEFNSPGFEENRVNSRRSRRASFNGDRIEEDHSTFSFGTFFGGRGGGGAEYEYGMGGGDYSKEYYRGHTPGSNGKVRRVSRVWMWENGKDGRTGAPFGVGAGGSADVLRGRYSRGTGATSFLPWRVIRPLARVGRGVYYLLAGNPLVRALATRLGLARGGFVNRVLGDVWRVLWVGIATWALVLVWFML